MTRHATAQTRISSNLEPEAIPGHFQVAAANAARLAAARDVR